MTAPSLARPALPLLAVLLLAGCTVSSRQAATEQPEENRFTRKVLVEGIDEPMQMEFDSQGRVYWIERTGGVKRLDETTGEVATLATIPVAVVGEAGLIGLLLDRDFQSTRNLYLYYSAPGEEREMHLSRFTLGADGQIDLASEVVMLRWPHEVASHMGGGMTWDADGNLYLSTGDNSNATQYTPIHWTNEGGKEEDAQRSSANTNDLRGKILRIRPQPDGSYTIPEGNLFPPGTPDTRPEIYIMGNRNPWRLSIDSETGYLHWGEVGPDAGADSAGIGPRGYDEFNVAKSAGNYGWPYFIGYNLPYNSYDYDARTYGAPFDPEHPVNPSPNNTGLRELPPARPAFLAYPYGGSEEFPLLATGGRNAVGGPIFHEADFSEAARPFPAHYEDKWFIGDFVRNWIMVVTMNEDHSKPASIERFLPDERYSSIMDLSFGPDGDLYVLEYGTQWFQQNADARLSKIEYNAGNRAPNVEASADRLAGALPLEVTLSPGNTVDYDGDDLDYEWVVTPATGGAPQRFTEASPTVTLSDPGAYTAVLTVTDPSGASGTGQVQIVAGNEPPEVALEVMEGNRSFYFPNAPVAYAVRVADREDGSLASGGIAEDQVNVTAEYVPSGVTPAEIAEAGEIAPAASMRNLRALRIIAGSDCKVCHTVESASAGPAFRSVAERYQGQEGAVGYLSQKIVQGGSGVWGEVAMPAHPALTPLEAATLAEYVLSLAQPDAAPQQVPVQGSYTAALHREPREGNDAAPQTGSYVIRATYTDQGANGVAPITAGDLVLLRYPRLAPETADVISDGITYTPSRDPGFIIAETGAYIGFKDIDLTGIAQIDVNALTRFYTWSHFVGAQVEVRLDAPDGPRMGSPAVKTPISAPERQGPQMQGGDGAPGGPVFLSGEPPASIDVSTAEGIHDLYIVFTNENAAPAEPLLLLTTIEFKRTGTTQTAAAAPADVTTGEQ